MMFGRSMLSSTALRRLSIAEYGEAAVHTVETSDISIYHPEGSISSNNNAFRVLRQICLPLYARTIANKPLFIANGTFPLFSDFRHDLLASLISLSEGTFFRDRLSAEHYGGIFCPDAAVTWPGSVVDEDCTRPFVLISTAAHATVELDRKLCRNAIDLCIRLNMKPLILTKGWQRLEGFKEEVLKMGGLFLEYATLNEAEKLLDGVSLHVGGRYHMAILCATKGIPSWLVMSNTHKNRWLAEEFSGIYILDSVDTNLEEAVSPNMILNPNVIKESVGTHSKDVSQSFTDMFKMITAHSKSGPSDHGLSALYKVWNTPNVYAELRNNYFRDSAKVILRSIHMMKLPYNHDLPT